MDVQSSPEQEADSVRNSHTAKTALADSGSMPLEVPQDRLGTFEPQLVEKYCRRLPGFDDTVVHLFTDVVRSWRHKWTYVIHFLALSWLLQKAIYTTNAIESLNTTVRRAVRARVHFTGVGAAKKLMYVATREASSKWKAPTNHWQSFKQELANHFEGRFIPSKGRVSKT